MKKIRITFNSPVVLSFVGICLVVTLLGTLTGNVSTQLFFMTYHSGLDNFMTYIRLFTHVFGHSGWEHFFGNAVYLLMLGPMIEEKYGSKTVIKIIAITALVTGIINYIFFWNVGLCGASGVVFAFIILSSYTGFNDGEIPITVILVATIYIGQQILDGIFVDDNISNMAHIVGGLVGSISGYKLNKKN